MVAKAGLRTNRRRELFQPFPAIAQHLADGMLNSVCRVLLQKTHAAFRKARERARLLAIHWIKGPVRSRPGRKLEDLDETIDREMEALVDAAAAAKIGVRDRVSGRQKFLRSRM